MTMSSDEVLKAAIAGRNLDVPSYVPPTLRHRLDDLRPGDESFSDPTIATRTGSGLDAYYLGLNSPIVRTCAARAVRQKRVVSQRLRRSRSRRSVN